MSSWVSISRKQFSLPGFKKSKQLLTLRSAFGLREKYLFVYGKLPSEESKYKKPPWKEIFPGD
jgi:hypothetical protein